MKKVTALLLLLTISSALIVSCKKESNAEEVFHEEKEMSIEKNNMDGHTSINSLDWEGTYEGTLPCKDCDGIFTELVLNNDNTYVLHSTNLMGDTKSTATTDGTYQWDESGLIITLNSKESNVNYKVGENTLTLLNENSEPMPKSEVANYTLLKKSI